jgi:hypothetical protein
METARGPTRRDRGEKGRPKIPKKEEERGERRQVKRGHADGAEKLANPRFSRDTTPEARKCAST